MFGKIILALSALAWASAQIPNLGFCPEYIPMPNFNMQRFLGVWYESERYFQLSEVVSRCVMTNYTKGSDGRYRVSNEVTNRFTGIKRILEGEIKPPASKSEEGKLHVKYTTVPLTPETKYSVLETDYDSYAVLWSCQGIGPVHAQNAWVMTRERIPSGKVLQKAYGVLDKYKISKTFFVKTDQADCAYFDPEETQREDKPDGDKKKRTPQPVKTDENVKSADALNNADSEIKEQVKSVPEAEAAEKAVDVSTSAKEAPEIIEIPFEIPIEIPIETLPERILKVAEVIKEDLNDARDKMIIVDINEENVAENLKEEASELSKKTVA